LNQPRSVKVPFRLNQHAPLIVVQGQVNGHGPVDMIVDTGASGTVISRELAQQAGIPLEGPQRDASGPDGSQKVVIVDLAQLEIGELQLNNLKVAAMDLARLNREAQMNASVILGYDFLRRFEVTINYAESWVEFKPLTPQVPESAEKLITSAG
jgi:clan AA aspartic protease (TIGR02281 family)